MRGVRDVIHPLVKTRSFLTSAFIKYRKRSEGIETQEVLNQLTSMGYRCIQIYHFSSPLPIDEKEDFLIKGEI